MAMRAKALIAASVVIAAGAVIGLLARLASPLDASPAGVASASAATQATRPSSTAPAATQPSGGSMTRVYQIEGMHCQSCAQNIQRRLETMPGITSAQVSFEDRKAYVSMAPVGAPADAQVERIVEEAGYTATPATQPVP